MRNLNKKIDSKETEKIKRQTQDQEQHIYQNRREQTAGRRELREREKDLRKTL